MKIQTLGLSDDVDPQAKIGFWKRQFLQESTASQRRFDWAYGVVIPIVCVVADPIVFADDGLLETYRPFAYLLSSTSIMAMVAWLLWGDRLGWASAAIGGLFIAGSIVSFIVGLILLPLSLLGLFFFLLGSLGLTPLFAGVVYLRNGLRAVRASKEFVEPRVVWQTAVLVGLLALVVPYVANVQFERLGGNRSNYEYRNWI